MQIEAWFALRLILAVTLSQLFYQDNPIFQKKDLVQNK